MGKSCVIIPTIKVGQEERESELFKSLLSFTNKDRDTTSFIWGLTRIPEISKLFNQKDENGEPTLESVIKVLDLKNNLEGVSSLNFKKVELGVIDSKGNPITYNKASDIIQKVISYNQNNQDVVADIHKTPKGYTISLDSKTIENSDVPNKLMFKNALNNQLLSFMRKLGFDVKIDGSLIYDGIFDPTHAEAIAEGLKTVIRISKGLQGEEAFPEEFCHLIIAGLLKEPLVRRTVNLLSDEEAIQNILGDSYNSYYKKYQGDIDLLAQEAAAKLLEKHIKGEVKPSTLLDRLWNYVKRLFGKTSVSEVDDIIIRANESFAQLSTEILNESIMPIIDKQSILDSRPLYKLGKDINKLESLANSALEAASKRLAIMLKKSKNYTYSKEDLDSIKNLQDLIEKKKYAKSCSAFLTDSLLQIEDLQKKLKDLLLSDKSDSDIQKISKISKTLRDIKQFKDGYEPIIKQMQGITYMRELGEVTIEEQDAKNISEKAKEISNILNNIDLKYKELRFSEVYNFLKLYWGEDKIISIGENKGQALTLEMILNIANKDINGVDRWFTSMSDASDPLLNLIAKVVKVTKAKRDSVIEDYLVKIRGLHQKLNNAGITNTEFMFERDSEGNLTGRLISNYDFERFNKERIEELKRLKDAGYKSYKIQSSIEAWERKHTKTIEISEGRFEQVPIYTKDNLSKLSPAQREYYDNMIKLKSILDSLIPERYTKLYNAIQIRNDLVSSISEAKNIKSAAKQILGNLKDNFIRRSDDTELDSNNNVLLDFSGKPVDRLPVYYTTPLEDVNRLSLDFTSSLLAYAGMAINYNEMNKVVDVLELTREMVHEREVKQYSGDRKITEAYKIVHNKFSKDYTKPGQNSNIGERLDDFYDVAVYNRIKRDQGNIKGTNLDTAKTLDTLKEYTGIVGLGLNVFSGVSNIIQGKIQMFIEAIGGEYFNYKNLAVGKKNYYALLPKYLGEINSTKKTNKLALLIDKFDALESFYNNLRDQGAFKGPISRILGSASLLFMNNMGEHYLHCRTMLSMLDNYKVKLNGKEISLFDAFEVEELTDDNNNVISAELILKEGVTKLDGSEFTNDDFIDLKLKIGRVNQALNGAFSEEDKGAIHKGALGRLAMQFRQWMPAHYNRRFSSSYYDAIMDEWREGYYMTLGKFTKTLIQDLTHTKFQLASNWDQLSPTEKANIRRALAEIGVFATLSILISLMGPEKDRKGIWLDRMIIYNLKRAKLEVGASAPLTVDFLQNIWTLVQNPAASIKTINNITDLFQFQNMWVELQSGRYKGWSEYQKDLFELLPVVPQIYKVKDLAEESYMFNIYNK